MFRSELFLVITDTVQRETSGTEVSDHSDAPFTEADLHVELTLSGAVVCDFLWPEKAAKTVTGHYKTTAEGAKAEW